MATSSIAEVTTRLLAEVARPASARVFPGSRTLAVFQVRPRRPVPRFGGECGWSDPRGLNIAGARTRLPIS
jgi:hypothetical protein